MGCQAAQRLQTTAAEHRSKVQNLDFDNDPAWEHFRKLKREIEVGFPSDVDRNQAPYVAYAEEGCRLRVV